MALYTEVTNIGTNQAELTLKGLQYEDMSVYQFFYFEVRVGSNWESSVYSVYQSTNYDFLTEWMQDTSMYVDKTTPVNTYLSEYDPQPQKLIILNLSQNTTYRVKISVCFNGNLYPPLGDTSTVTTFTTSRERPSNWSWGVNISSGQPITNIISANWNSFIDRVISFLHYKGHAYEEVISGERTLYGLSTYGITREALCIASKMTDNNILTATKFNNINFCILCMYSTNISRKVTGEKVKAEYFNTLQDSLNSVN